MASILLTYCRHALNVLGAQFKASSALSHGTSAGTVREHLIRDFLEAHLPETITLVSGQLFDSNDVLSNQQDIVLVLKSVPRLPFAKGVELIYAEGVVAILEVKSSLSGSVLASIGSSIAGVRKLKRSIVGGTSLGGVHNWPADRILSLVATYGGSSLSNLETTLSSMRPDELPDMVIDLGKGLLVRNHGLLMPLEAGAQYIRHDDPAEGLMLFLTHLTEITGTLVIPAVDWREYI